MAGKELFKDLSPRKLNCTAFQKKILSSSSSYCPNLQFVQINIKDDFNVVMTHMAHIVQSTCQIKLCGCSSLSQHSFTKLRNTNGFIDCRVWKCF